MNLSENEILIVSGVKEYSKVFLETMGGFYPFAISLQMDKQIVSIGASDGSDFPESQDLIYLLEKSISNEIIEKKYILAAICIDVFIHEKIEDVDTKKDAIEIRFVSSSYRKTVQLVYELDGNNKVTFKNWNYPRSAVNVR
jgi:hypothetical protein